jgi:hypothetical protein
LSDVTSLLCSELIDERSVLPHGLQALQFVILQCIKAGTLSGKDVATVLQCLSHFIGTTAKTGPTSSVPAPLAAFICRILLTLPRELLPVCEETSKPLLEEIAAWMRDAQACVSTDTRLVALRCVVKHGCPTLWRQCVVTIRSLLDTEHCGDSAVTTCLSALATLACNVTLRPLIATQAMIGRVQHILVQHKSSCAIQDAGISVLAHCCGTEHSSPVDVIGEKGVQLVFAAMDAFPRHIIIQVTGCSVIAAAVQESRPETGQKSREE